MAIRIREINGRTIALCAARSIPKAGDIYLDDCLHEALAAKFSADWNSTLDTNLPHDNTNDDLVEQEESNNPNRLWWEETYGS